MTSPSSPNANGFTIPATSDTPSWKRRYTSPPKVKNPYVVAEALDDLPGVSYALEMFLASHMVESEEYCDKNDIKK